MHRHHPVKLLNVVPYLCSPKEAVMVALPLVVMHKERTEAGAGQPPTGAGSKLAPRRPPRGKRGTTGLTPA